MLIIDKEQVYRIPEDALMDILERDALADLVEQYQTKSEAIFHEEITDVISEVHAQILIQSLRRSNPVLRELTGTLYAKMWAIFKGENDLVDFKLAMTPTEVPHNVHNEAGQCYDFDNMITIGCADCDVKSDQYLKWADNLVDLKRRADAGEEVTVELITAMMSEPRFVDEDQSVIGMDDAEVMVMSADGSVYQTTLGQLQLDDATSGFDDDAPAPTHQVPKSLN